MRSFSTQINLWSTLLAKSWINTRSGVEETRLWAKDIKKSEAKDTNASVFLRKRSEKFFSVDLQKNGLHSGVGTPPPPAISAAAGGPHAQDSSVAAMPL